MTKREKELFDKIEQLERRVKWLESLPRGETHHYYHPQPGLPLYPVLPCYPTTPVSPPWWTQPITWCASVGVNDLVDRSRVTVNAAAITYGPEH